jgi:hypothetical protein
MKAYPLFTIIILTILAETSVSDRSVMAQEIQGDNEGRTVIFDVYREPGQSQSQEHEQKQQEQKERQLLNQQALQEKSLGLIQPRLEERQLHQQQQFEAQQERQQKRLENQQVQRELQLLNQQ